MRSIKSIHCQALLLTLLFCVTSPAIFAAMPKNLPVMSTSLKYPPLGLAGMTSLRLYASPQYRALIKPLRSREPKEIDRAILLIRDAYAKDPNAQDLYVARIQADTPFRVSEWKHYRNLQSQDVENRFRRGVTILYRAHEWRSQVHGTDFLDLVEEAVTDLEYVWRRKPTNMSGAMLMDVYDLNAMSTGSKANPVPFTEEFLKFADPIYTWPLYQQAKRTNFTNVSFDPKRIPEGKAHLVAGILGERWSLLYNFPSPNKNEKATMEKWWRSIPIND